MQILETGFLLSGLFHPTHHLNVLSVGKINPTDKIQQRRIVENSSLKVGFKVPKWYSRVHRIKGE